MLLACRRALLLSVLAISSSCANAQQSGSAPGLGIKLGDDVRAVRTTLRTDLEPEPMPRSSILPESMPDPNKGKTFLHLRTKGVWVFFDPKGKAETIRLDAPYAGQIKGVRLGDSVAKLKSTLGEPLKKPWTVFFTMQAYRYVLDDTAYVRFDVNDDGVQQIFITR